MISASKHVGRRLGEEEDEGGSYTGSGIFLLQGVSISAGLDIICCNSARGIIDLSTGSRHRSHHPERRRAAAGATAD